MYDVSMTIFLGTDHAGFTLKEELKRYLREKKYTVIDCGAREFNKDDDYTDFCKIAAEETSQNSENRGFVFGKSGAGECIVANKVRGIRCVLAVNKENVLLAREHNDANMLSIGFRFIKDEDVFHAIKIWLETPDPTEERHIRRVEKIKTIENSK